jgi:hypothetical protein
MPNPDFARLKLHNQRIPLAGAKFDNAVEVVAWLGAVQSQEYAGAKWSLGLRMNGAVDHDVDRAFDEGAILRTHVMRPTWHFVTPADIRWLLELTAPRVLALNAYMERQLKLDGAVFARTHAAIGKALQGNQYLTRTELGTTLAEVGIQAEGQRLGYLMMRAELDGVICSGPRRGKQFTYALIDKRAPQAKSLARDEALAELTRRYFTSHGPATAHDFAAWSGLTITDSKAGLEMVKEHFVQEEIDGKTYWYTPADPIARDPSPTAHLLPTYDEYAIVMRDGSLIYDPAFKGDWQDLPFFGLTVIDGIIVGNWRRTVSKKAVTIESAPFRPFTDSERDAFAAAAQRFGAFLELPILVK